MEDKSQGDEFAVNQALEEQGHIKPSKPMSIETQKAIIKYENKLKAEIAKTTTMNKPSEKADAVVAKRMGELKAQLDVTRQPTQDKGDE